MAKDHVIPEDTQRVIGKSAQRNNILAAKIIASTIRTTLGPKGMDKMLVNQFGQVTVTNDGVTILRELTLEHPAAKMIADIAQTQEDEVGDGTTSAVIIAGELLSKAENLLDKNVHPTIITKGYRLAADRAKSLIDTYSFELKPEHLPALAKTAMTGKGAELSEGPLVQTCVKAVESLQTLKREKVNVLPIVDQEHDHELVSGLILDKARVHNGMPQEIQHPKILCLNTALQMRDMDTDARISITSPDQVDAFIKQEETMIKTMVKRIVESGANVVLCQKGIDELAQFYLAKSGVYAVRRVKKQDIDAVSDATGATIITNLEELQSSDLGACEKVEELHFGEQITTALTGCKDVCTIVLSAPTQHVVAELGRAVEDAIGDLVTAQRTKKLVAGAGAIDIEISRGVRTYAMTLEGREQLAVLAFADALETIPATLAENGGLDSIDLLTRLKSAHEDKPLSGIDVFSGKVIDAVEQGILEPARIKLLAIESATQVANLILRIDDVIAAGPLQEQPDTPM